ncbi:MAG: sporulation protein YabP [Clostridiales bacterium]|jgi:sporulation protein YabP|nr:sporulation protein YabP [Clostridiales bacterium]
MTEEKKGFNIPHNCILEDRRILSISGVSDVDSFDEQTVTVFTDLGELTIKGHELHITRLSVDVGELVVEGKIQALSYTDAQPKSAGFLSKVFR